MRGDRAWRRATRPRARSPKFHSVLKRDRSKHATIDETLKDLFGELFKNSGGGRARGDDSEDERHRSLPPVGAGSIARVRPLPLGDMGALTEGEAVGQEGPPNTIGELGAD